MTNTDIIRITNTNTIVLDVLDMDELVHEADCLAQARRELLSGTTHAGQEAQKYLVGELAMAPTGAEKRKSGCVRRAYLSCASFILRILRERKRL